jgi:hypothetical protein
VGWFAFRPGVGTFFFSLCAFFLWVSMAVTEYVIGKVRPWGRKIEQVVREATGESPALPETADPKLKKVVDLLRLAEGRPDQRAMARRGLAVSARLPGLVGSFESVLDEKLHSGELTHERYLAAGRRVYDSTLGELQLAARSLMSESPSAAEHLARSETALAEMTRITHAVSEMRGRDSNSPKFEEAIRDLRELAERTKRY